MDGVESERSAHSIMEKMALKVAEKIAVGYSDIVVGDSEETKRYFSNKFKTAFYLIPNAAGIFDKPNASLVSNYDLKPLGYDLIISDIAPRHHLETILQGFCDTHTNRDLVIVGNYFSEFGLLLKERFCDDRIKFIGVPDNADMMNNLRYFSNIYFHNDSLGGTHHHLLQAIASNSLICTLDNTCNRQLLGDDGYYFSDKSSVAEYVNSLDKTKETKKLQNNRIKIQSAHNLTKVADQYDRLFQSLSKPEVQLQTEDQHSTVVVA
ncbi:MAG: glycosyltransferase family 1 protein [Cyclobacteriaceae bacterium]|nr:glycosyltransferase family 1 protein [Cyclobacteriaceae bacterium]